MTSGAIAALAERALKWSALTTAARFVLQFAAQVALARMLGPGNFGVYGIGIATLTFVGFLSGASFSYGLMLQPKVDEEDIRFSFTWQMLAGLLAGVAMFASAPTLAHFFGDERIEGVVQLLSLASVLMAAAAPATYLLQRDLDFRRLGLIQLASYAAGYLAVGVPMAMAGYGAYALAAACVVQAGVALVATYRARPHSLKPLLRHANEGETLTTGRAVFLTNVVNWLLGNLDRVIIGRVLSAHAVGIFTVAYNLASIPNALLVGALQPAFVATGARLQESRERLAQGWQLAIGCILVLALPAAVVLALLSSNLVQFLYGNQWTETAWVLALMFLCLPAWACFALSTPVLWNTGRKQHEFLLQLPLLALAGTAWWFVAPQGVRAIAMVSGGILILRAVVIVAASLRALDLRWITLLPCAARGVALSAFAGLATFAGQEAVAAIGSPLLALAAGGLCATASLLAVLFLRPAALGIEARTALSRMLPVIGSRLAPRSEPVL